MAAVAVDHCRNADDVRAAAERAREKRKEWFAPHVEEITREEVAALTGAPVAPPAPQVFGADRVFYAPAHATFTPAQTVLIGVAGALGMSVEDMLADAFNPTAARGRRIASALLVRRLYLPRQEAAKFLGLVEPVVADALRAIDPILSRHSLSAFSKIEDAAAIVCKEWDEGFPVDRQPPIIDIQRAVCRVFDIPLVDLNSARRTAHVVRARQVAMGITRQLTRKSLPEIGRRFGGRDHTTVLHAIRKLEPLMRAVALSVGPDAPLTAWAERALEYLEHGIPPRPAAQQAPQQAAA
jgi:hypothetical protein